MVVFGSTVFTKQSDNHPTVAVYDQIGKPVPDIAVGNGEMLEITGEQDDWYSVKFIGPLYNGRAGFVKKKNTCTGEPCLARCGKPSWNGLPNDFCSSACKSRGAAPAEPTDQPAPTTPDPSAPPQGLVIVGGEAVHVAVGLDSEERAPTAGTCGNAVLEFQLQAKDQEVRDLQNLIEQLQATRSEMQAAVGKERAEKESLRINLEAQIEGARAETMSVKNELQPQLEAARAETESARKKLEQLQTQS